MNKIWKKEIVCTKCEGIGFLPDVNNYNFHTLKCPFCKGEGYIVEETDVKTGYTIIFDEYECV